MNSHMQKDDTRFIPYTIHKINSKWVKDLDIRPEKKTQGRKLLGLSLGNYVFNLTPKAKATKAKVSKTISN